MKRVLLIAALSAGSAAAQAILTETIGTEDFSFPRLAKLARARLDARSEPVVRLTMFAVEPPPFFLTQSSLEGFGAWLAAWKSASKVRWRVAEAIAIGGDASLRIRMGRSISRLVLKGKDPLQVTVEGRRYEILNVSSATPGTLAIYARGLRPLPCEALLRQLRERIPLRLTVHLRTDHWFLRDPGFPPYYWFAAPETPTPEAVAAGAQASCGG
jgi:hypothetical protein